MASSNPLIIFSFLLMMAAKKVHSQTSFNINAFTNNSLLLTYERDATVLPDEIFVRLTRPDPSDPINTVSAGRVLYTAPVKLWEQGKQASFETTITLQVTSANKYGGVYGMTFFVIPVNSTTTDDGKGSSLGIYDSLVPGSPTFVVEFDTAIDSFDPDYSHIGININSKTSQNTSRFDNLIAGHSVTARITYDAPTRKTIAVFTSEELKNTATVSFAFNLKAYLPQQVQVGLSAASTVGTFSSYFDVYKWHFNSTMVDDSNIVVSDNTSLNNVPM